MDLYRKLDILAGAAKYDASCASSGSRRKGALGAAVPSGVCHSWAADGRCISLLKVLFSNQCRYDCAYCVNRRSNDHPRARFTPAELAELTVAFYRRNTIEGLFLSSAVFAGPDATLAPMLEALRLLRRQYRFGGYIHLKLIPGCSPELIRQAALLADRLSTNIELPTAQSLQLLAPEKTEGAILATMDGVEALRKGGRDAGDGDIPSPAGQSTQLIVGATADSDALILRRAEGLYRGVGLKRVYYSAYVPVNGGDSRLPAVGGAPPLLREHRLYQADWLLRCYGFEVDELLDDSAPDLDLRLDPKAAWALRHLDRFPLEVHRAELEELLRVPGIGVRSARRILVARRRQRLGAEELKRLGVVMKRARFFLTSGGRYLGPPGTAEKAIAPLLLAAPGAAAQPAQLAFDFTPPTPATAQMALSGEL